MRGRTRSCRAGRQRHDDDVHVGQVSISSDQVVALIAEQVPELAGLDIVAIDGSGTVNAIFRIGEAVTARFPLRVSDPDDALAQLRLEAAASTEFRRASPFLAPMPLHIGRPGHGYPMPWATQSWLPGSTASPTAHAKSAQLALDIANLIHHLRRWPTRGRCFNGHGRGGRLEDHDEWIEECITRSDGLLDTDVMRALWSRFRELPREDSDVMCHGDLIPANVLVFGEQLAGVLDTGGFGPADPALDLVAAWHFFADEPREQLRNALNCRDLQWERGAAWAFQQAAGAYWYYQHTNPAMAEMGRTTLDRLCNVYA